MMLKKLFSTPYVVALLIVFGVASGAATFIESMYDTQTAWKVVYDALWYETVMVLLALLMIGVILRTQMYKKFAIFLFHIAFIVILIASAMTRYMGQEAVIHIREGRKDNHMITTKTYLKVELEGVIKDKVLTMGQIGNNDFSYDFDVNGTSLTISYLNYLPKQKEGLDKVVVNVTYQGEKQTLTINGGRGWVEPPVEARFKDKTFLIAWGSKVIELPFAIRLQDFKLERYPGSQSPSSYSSDVVLEDEANHVEKIYEIYMNHPLVYGDYKFFQSSYDQDERGTILEVNQDPGKWPTYFAYLLLTLGFIGSFFTKGSRFVVLKRFLKNSHIVWLVALGIGTLSTPIQAADRQTQAYLSQFREHVSAHSQDFGSLLIQDHGGRIKPINTEALDLIYKITGKSTLFGLSSEEIVLGMLIHPKQWQDIEMIKIKNKVIKKRLKLPMSRSYVSFNQMFNEEGRYRLAQEVNDANRKAESKRGTFEKDLIKFDERLNVAYLTYKGVLFRFVPVIDGENNQWVDLSTAAENPQIDEETKSLLFNYFESAEIALQSNDWRDATALLTQIKALQTKASQEIVPSDTTVKVEILYNKLSIFKKLFIYYFLLGLVALMASFVYIFRNQRSRIIDRAILWFFLFGFVAHTLGLGMRWYISGHAPWSNSYESLVYIGWSAILAGIVVFRRSTLALAAASLLAAVIMLVAHLSFMNPQVTNLVPVLKSYWLSIHVSVITASYGFLGLSCMLGIIILMLMMLKNHKRTARINTQIRYISAINEMSLMIGLATLTVGNFFGGIWANESWGRYWGWDPKETWALVAIITYTVVLHLRLIPKLNSIYVLSVSSVFAFYTVVMTYFGVNFYLTGMHSYAASDSSPEVPHYVYYITEMLVLIAVLAYRKREVKTIEEDHDA